MDEEIDLIWSPEAFAQLRSNFEYLAERDLEAAKRWLTRIDELVEGLLVTPEIGRIVPEYGRAELRERLHGKSYRLIYRLRSGQVEVAAIWHTANPNLPAL